MPIIRFATNISQTVHLRSLEGRQVDSQFGGSQWMFQSEEGNFYVSEKVGAILGDQFNKLGVKPGDDFARYANGHWLDTVQIPPDRASWGSFALLRERSLEQVRDILDALHKDSPRGSN